MEPSHCELVTAATLESRGILSRSTAWKMAKRGLLPVYEVGPHRRGIRFRVDEVLSALRRPTRLEADHVAGVEAEAGVK